MNNYRSSKSAAARLPIMNQRDGGVFSALAAILGVTVVILALAIFGIFYSLLESSRRGISGTEFIGLIVIGFGAPLLGFIAFLNLLVLTGYFVRRRPTGRTLLLPVLSAAMSMCAFGWVLYIY